MSVINEALESVSGYFQSVMRRIKAQVFGSNNERLDFIMDSFYKLEPAKRNVVVGLSLFLFIVLFVVIGVFYHTSVKSLQTELSKSFQAIHELNGLKSDYAIADSQFEKLASNLERKTRNLKMKPFFEKLSKQQQVSIENLEVKNSDLGADNPLGEKITEVVSNMRVPKVSIPRLLNFLVEIEKSNKFLRVQDLVIRGRFGTKLYFDAEVKVRGYLKK